MPLTDLACKSAKPKLKPYKISDFQGLYLHVTPSGSKLWRFKYRYHKKEKLLSLGSYPLISLADARAARERARKLLHDGIDPSEVRQAEKKHNTQASEFTFEVAAREWHDKNRAGWSEDHAKTVLSRLEKDLFPVLGKTPLAAITTPILAQAIELIDIRGAQVVARRSLQYSRAIFAYARIQGKVENNPAEIKPSDFLTPRKKTHFASLEGKDLPEFIEILFRNEARLFRQTQLAMILMLLTFVRTSELIKAKWSEIDFEKCMWIIPAERMKMKRDHLVPLSAQSVTAFKELQKLNGHRPYVFPGQRDPLSHMSNGAVLMALYRMGYKGEHTGHGFRALGMSTLMEELAIPHAVIDVQLAHEKKNDIDAAYNRAKFLTQRVEMMGKWGNYIEKMIPGLPKTASDDGGKNIHPM